MMTMSKSAVAKVQHRQAGLDDHERVSENELFESNWLDLLDQLPEQGVCQEERQCLCKPMEPTVEAWEEAMEGTAVWLPGKLAADARECGQLVRQALRSMKVGPDLQSETFPSKQLFLKDVMRVVRKEEGMAGGQVNRYANAWRAFVQETYTEEEIQETLQNIYKGVRIDRCLPWSAKKVSEPQHKRKVAGVEALLRTAIYKEAEVKEMMQQNRPGSAVFRNRVKPEDEEFVDEQVKLLHARGAVIPVERRQTEDFSAHIRSKNLLWQEEIRVGCEIRQPLEPISTV
jgi:hypothetical protein